MQAGDKLDFIAPFDVTEPTRVLSDEERSGQMLVFGDIMQRLVFGRPELVTSLEVLDQAEESSIVTVFEASYRLDMPDGSYLHILGFGHRDDEGLLDAGVSVIEHTDDGIYNGGYVYTCGPDGVRRTTAPPDREDSGMDEDDRRMHFSVIDLYRQRDQLEELEQSEDITEVMAAIEIRAHLDDDILMGRLAAEMGVDDCPPHQGELEQLAVLINDAYYFPLATCEG